MRSRRVRVISALAACLFVATTTGAQTDSTEHPSVVARIPAPPGTSRFGQQIVVDGKTMMVVADRMPFLRGDTSDTFREGIIVYALRGETWEMTQAIRPSDSEQTRILDIALDGDLAVIAVTEGVHIYRREDGVWSLEQILRAPEHTERLYGWGMEAIVYRDTIMVSAPIWGTREDGREGMVFVYQRARTQWMLQDKLSIDDVPEDPDRPRRKRTHMGFGSEMVIGDNRLFVVDRFGWNRDGRIYVYRWTSSGWDLTEEYIGSTGRVAGVVKNRLLVDRHDWDFFDRDKRTWSHVAEVSKPAGRPYASTSVAFDYDVFAVARWSAPDPSLSFWSIGPEGSEAQTEKTLHYSDVAMVAPTDDTASEFGKAMAFMRMGGRRILAVSAPKHDPYDEPWRGGSIYLIDVDDL